MKNSRIKKILYDLGYSSRQISDDYMVQISGSSALKFDSIAFSNEYIQDVSTSCIAIQEVNDNDQGEYYIANTKYAATPILILTLHDNVQVWNVTPEKQRLIIEDKFELINLYFEKNRFEFMSENLVQAKYGIRQITLFEAIGLIDFTRNVTCKILRDEFMKGLVAGKQFLDSLGKSKRQDISNLTSITMHVLSALVINCKINNRESVPDIHCLLGELSNRYKSYFSSEMMFKYGRGLIQKIYDAMDPSINYKSVDHELLGYFYESTLFQIDKAETQKIRKEYGIYYTPRFLSDEIINAIPVESIPEKNRKVFDGSCGSGSLLISACKRLEKLIDYNEGEKIHEYLTQSITGYDFDRFASEVARLSLLLYNLPYGNKWNILTADLLLINELEYKPTIILGNPPYEEKRGDSKKSQKATEFINRYMQWLSIDGYMGIILPESYLQNDSSIVSRRILLNNFDIQEIWCLPGTVFENNCATIVIIAKKVSEPIKNNITKIKVLTRNANSLTNFPIDRKWDFIFFVNSQNSWRKDPKAKISFSPLGNIVDKIKMKNGVSIKDIAYSTSGIMMPVNYAKYSTTPCKGWVPYITNADYFTNYYMSNEMLKNIYYFNYDMSSDDLQDLKQWYKGLRLRKKSREIFESRKKVLVKLSSTPGDIRCIGALIDDKKIYPSHSFFIIVSKEENSISSEIICALINSKIINAYVRMNCVKRTITTDIIRSIPIPYFTEEQKMQLKEYVMLIMKANEEER
jgi:type I restriction-modification system DNA methylase subunit